MSDLSDLDQRLGALFADQNLALAPRSDATGVVLGRVRQVRRRRRAVRIAAPVLLSLLLGAFALTDFGSQLRSAPTTPAVKPSPTVTTTAPFAELRMSASGVGPLRLGMSRAELEASGLVTLPGTEFPGHPGCLAYTGTQGIVGVDIDSHGLRQIQAYTWIRTPEGVGAGDTYTRVKAVYGSAAKLPKNPLAYILRVQVQGRTDSWYVFTFDIQDGPIRPADRVVAVALQNGDAKCG